MAILITGMSGFVGLGLAEALIAAGNMVVGFSRASLPNGALEAPLADGRAIAIEGDIRDEASLRKAFCLTGIDAVVHCAAVTANLARERRAAPEVIDVNIGGAALVTHLAAERGVRRVVIAGSGAVYPDYVHEPYAILDEEVPQAPKTLYEIGKASSEAVALRIGDIHGLSVVVARLGQVFGPWERDTGSRDTLSPILQLTDAARAGRSVTLARPYLKNWHYCRDAAAALATLAEADRPRHRVYNIAPAASWRLTDWAALLAARYEDFRYRVGLAEEGKHSIELYGDKDTAFMSWQRYAEEFGPTARYGLTEAFTDFINWLDR